MKTKERSRKRIRKLDGIEVAMIGTVPFSSDFTSDSITYDLDKTESSECASRSGRINQSQCSFSGSPLTGNEKKNMVALDDTVAEAVRKFSVLYDKSCKDFKDKTRNKNAWGRLPNNLGFDQVAE